MTTLLLVTATNARLTTNDDNDNDDNSRKSRKSRNNSKQQTWNHSRGEGGEGRYVNLSVALQRKGRERGGLLVSAGNGDGLRHVGQAHGQGLSSWWDACDGE